MVTLDPMSKAAIETRKKINELCDKRLDIGNRLFGNEGINYIRNIESLETRLANCKDVNIIGEYSAPNRASRPDELSTAAA